MGMTHEDMLDYGYIHENGVYLLPSGIIPPEAYLPQPLLVSDPKYPDFDPRQLPWTTAPSYIQDIIYMGLEGAATTSNSSYKMPFVAIRVNSSGVDVYVGVNCFLGAVASTGNIRVCNSLGAYSDLTSYCYYASFSQAYKMKTDWVKCSYSEWGDTGKVFTYTSKTFLATDYKVDLYLYGGNGARAGNYTSVNIPTTSSATVVIYQDQYLGFNSGRYFPNPANYTNLYVSTFVPPTPQEVEQETQKGIWASIKALPGQIADSIKGFFTSLGDRISGFFEKLVEDIKGLFVPADGFFDTYTQEFQDYFADRFGILYELPGAVVDLFQQFIDFEPATDGYYIPIPEVVLPIRLEDGTYENFVILEEQNFEFDFLSEGAIGTLYRFYRSFVWLICVLGLISLAVRKFNKITGGDG